MYTGIKQITKNSQILITNGGWNVNLQITKENIFLNHLKFTVSKGDCCYPPPLKLTDYRPPPPQKY